MTQQKQRRRFICMSVFLLLAAVGLYGLLPQIDGFSTSLSLLAEADLPFVVAAFVAGLSAVACSAAIYKTIAKRKITYRETLLVQLAGLFINRVLPAGIGGLGLSFLYLRKKRHTRTEASAVVLVNSIVGFTGHGILLLVAITFLAISGIGDIPALRNAWWLPIVIVVSMVAAVYAGLKIAFHAKPALAKQVKVVGSYYRNRPKRLVLAVAISCLLTISNAAALWFSCLSLTIDLAFPVVFTIFTLGIALGTATPTPGGLGGLEAAIVAGLIAVDVTAPLALAAALLYRLVTFWIGLFIGLIAFIFVHKIKLINI